ncbi:glycosyltransferase family 4 protein [Thiorhodococcus mannitoliphagus]|uniref:glycosyltransferase family 4 protein n=1 Tax=Thiorhodococcus mannitoliphagus TaxID=329406 RepID=UPI00197FBD61|nr:glycosyltransferase family 4 protein [Thiorhodococcus mannitoliphagus]
MTSRFGRTGLVGRGVDYLSFYLSAAWRLRRLVRPDDLVVAMTDPPLLSVLVRWALVGRRVTQVNWLQDLFPEVASALQLRLASGSFGRMLQRWRDVSLRAAALNVVIGERMAERVREAGVTPERVRVIHNWADDEAIRPLSPAANPLRHEWGLTDAFVLGYSGNLGRAHDVATVLEAAEVLHADPGVDGQRVVLLFIGSGHQLLELRAESVRRGLDTVQFRPYQPRERLSESLGVADVHWISLRPALEGLIVPSKFYGIAAAGRPVLFVGDHDGEIARLLRTHDCGTAVAERDGQAFAAAVRRLRDDPGLRQRQGDNARRLLEEGFKQRLALGAWGGIVRALSTGAQ